MSDKNNQDDKTRFQPLPHSDQTQPKQQKPEELSNISNVFTLKTDDGSSVPSVTRLLNRKTMSIHHPPTKRTPPPLDQAKESNRDTQPPPPSPETEPTPEIHLDFSTSTSSQIAVENPPFTPAPPPLASPTTMTPSPLLKPVSSSSLAPAPPPAPSRSSPPPPLNQAAPPPPPPALGAEVGTAQIQKSVPPGPPPFAGTTQIQKSAPPGPPPFAGTTQIQKSAPPGPPPSFAGTAQIQKPSPPGPPPFAGTIQVQKISAPTQESSLEIRLEPTQAIPASLAPAGPPPLQQPPASQPSTRPAPAPGPKTTALPPLTLWNEVQLGISSVPVEKSASSFIELGATGGVYLEIIPSESPIPSFKSTASFLPGKRQMLWTGIHWKPDLTLDIWNHVFREGHLEYSPAGAAAHLPAQRNALRSAFGVDSDEWILLVRTGTPKTCKGILVLVSKKSLLTEATSVLSLLQEASN